MLVALRPPVHLRGPRRDADSEYQFLERRFSPHTVFMEIGGAQGGEMSKLALRAASYVERVYAVDVSGRVPHDVLVPCNLRLVLCDGVRIPVPQGAVDIAWSGAFMDQLHPDDVREHLKSVRRGLAAGGEYLCATGKSVAETLRSLVDAGFSKVRYYAGSVRVPRALSSLVPRHLLRIAATK